jgi:hypothetical protein
VSIRDTTVAFLFSPFDHTYVLATVLTKIRADRASRKFRRAFVNLRTPDDAAFRRHDWLRCTARWIEKKMTIVVYKNLEVSAPSHWRSA